MPPGRSSLAAALRAVSTSKDTWASAKMNMNRKMATVGEASENEECIDREYVWHGFSTSRVFCIDASLPEMF